VNMQTLSVEIQDDYLQSFLEYVKQNSSKISISKDKNLAYDPYFYERQKELQQDLEDIDSGKAEMIEHNELWANLHNRLQTIK